MITESALIATSLVVDEPPQPTNAINATAPTKIFLIIFAHSSAGQFSLRRA